MLLQRRLRWMLLLLLVRLLLPLLLLRHLLWQQRLQGQGLQKVALVWGGAQLDASLLQGLHVLFIVASSG
jgi:hypothetical protein